MSSRILQVCLLIVALLGFSAVGHAQSPSAFPYSKTVPNDPSVGTTQFTLTKINSSGKAVIMASTDTVGYSGICISNCGKSGTAWIAFAGLIPLVMENTTTAGHYVQIGSTTGGDGHDTGATTYPTSGGDVIGKVQTGAAAAGMAMVDLNAESVASSSGGGGLTATGTPSSPELACWSGSTSLTNCNLSGDGSTANTSAFTLATVNSNVGSFTNPTITVNAKGLITAASNGSGGGIASFVVTTGGNFNPVGNNWMSLASTFTAAGETAAPETLWPRASTVIAISCSAIAVQAASQTVTFTLRDNATNTAAVCTLDSTHSSASATGLSVSISSGDKLDILVAGTATASGTPFAVTLVMQ